MAEEGEGKERGGKNERNHRLKRIHPEKETLSLDPDICIPTRTVRVP